MLLEEQANKYLALHHWFQTPQGIRVAQAFYAELAPIIKDLRGDSLLQLGNCGDNGWLSLLNFRHKWLVSACSGLDKNAIVTSLTTLPIERDSIDCVIAPLTLEAFPRGKNPIDEIDRVLKPMGYVIFLGVNPVSFWGAALRFGYLHCFGPKAHVALMSSLTLKRTMIHRGYSQCALTSFYYIPPVRNPFLIRNLAFFNEMGKMVWPFPAAFYCFIMQKYQPCLPSLREEMVNGNELIGHHKPSLQPISNGVHKI